MGGGGAGGSGGDATSGGGTPIATGGGPTGLTGGGGTTGTGGSETSTGGSETSTGGSPPMNGAQPPARGPNRAGDGSGAVFALSKLYLGDTDRNGTPDHANGWKLYGYNVDGQITNCQGNQCQQVHNHCKPAAGGSPASAYPDGHNGIDNSFGANILPILLAIQSDFSGQENQSITAGRWTVLFDIEALGSGDEYNPLTSRLYVGASLGHAPAFDGSDAWPVRPEWLTDPSDVTTSKLSFPQSYVISNTWVSGPGGHIVVPLLIAGFELDLDVGSAVASFEMPAAHTSGTNGTIAGALDTEQFASAFKKAAGAFDPSLCSGTTIDSIVNQLRQASDIMKDGSPGGPSQTCDGISIGLGFDAKPVTLGGVGDPASTNDPCGP